MILLQYDRHKGCLKQILELHLVNIRAQKVSVGFEVNKIFSSLNFRLRQYWIGGKYQGSKTTADGDIQFEGECFV